MEEIGPVLVKFLVLAVIFEVALHPIFNWSVYKKNPWFSVKDSKPVIAFVIAVAVFAQYKLDIFADVLNALGEAEGVKKSPALFGQVITALLISGGSEGIRKIMQAIKLRDTDDDIDDDIYLLGGKLEKGKQAAAEARTGVSLKAAGRTP